MTYISTCLRCDTFSGVCNVKESQMSVMTYISKCLWCYTFSGVCDFIHSQVSVLWYIFNCLIFSLRYFSTPPPSPCCFWHVLPCMWIKAQLVTQIRCQVGDSFIYVCSLWLIHSCVEFVTHSSMSGWLIYSCVGLVTQIIMIPLLAALQEERSSSGFSTTGDWTEITKNCVL